MLRKKKSRFGLEEDFREVKNAGYTATKKVKRDKTVNRRAGLHDKLKNLQGEARVKRCKPLAIKHVRRLRKVAALSSIGVVGLVAVFGVGFLAPAKDIQLDGEFETVCYATPTDGSKPTDHTLVENVGYMNYVLKNRLFWSSQSTSDVDAVALGVPAKQSVDNYKQYYNGVLISADCSFSSVSESMQYGEQFCQIDNAVLSRYSTSKKTEDLEKGMDAPWSTDPATGMTVKAFRRNRGNPPLEFSVYVLNELTISNAQDYTVADNGDGTYSMSLLLNTNTGVDETSADYYYRLQMQVNGGLNDLPTIYTTTLTYTFDESWRVLKLEVDDEYKVTALGMPSNCTSHTKTEYYYSEEKARNTFWEDYFKAEYDRQKGSMSDDAVIDKEEAPTAMECLATAFGSVLSEGAVFKVDLGLENFNLNGVICVEMQDSKLSGLSAKLGDILVWFDGNTLYINDGSSKYKADIGSLLSAGGETEEENGASAQGLDGGLDLNALMNQMTSGEFVYNDETGVAALKSQVELFGLKIPMNFEFKKTESGIELNFLKAEIAFGDKTVNADLRFGDESDKPAKPNDTTGYTDILTDGVTFDISLIIDGLKLDGVAKIIMREGAFGGVYATLGDMGVYYDYPRNMLYLSAGNAKYKLDVSALGTGDFDASDILKLINIDKLFANITTGETSLGTSLDLTVLEKVLTAAINVNLGGGINLGANVTFGNLNASFTATLVNKTVTLPADLETYADILNGDLTLDVSLTLLTGLADKDGTRNEVVLAGKVALCLQGGKLVEIRADFGDFAVYYEFVSNVIYIKVGETKVKIAIGEMELGALSTVSLFSDDGNVIDLPAAVKDLLQNFVATGKIISSNADLSVLGSVIPVWANINLDGGISVKAGMSLFGIDAVAQVEIGSESPEALSEEEKAEYTDVLKDGWNIVDGLLGEHISATVSGTVYSYTDEYKEQNNIKYNFNATLDYDKGHTVTEEGESVSNGFPVHIDKGTVDGEGNGTGVNFYIDSTLYLHFGLALEATKPGQDSLYLDLWLLDGTPATDGKGITTADALGKNGELDVYIKISKYKEAGKAYPVYDKDGNKKLDANGKEITVVGEPLCLYAPVSEIMTLVSMAGAAADLHGLTFENNEELTKLASDIADIVDQLLISNYLPYTQDQFASLGNSLIPQILGISLNDLLGKLIGSAGTVVENTSVFKLDFSEKYVKSLTYGDNTLVLTLDSALLFGADIKDDMSVTLEKSPLNGVDYLSSVSLKNLYTDDNTQKLDLGLNLSYGEIARPAQMEGYRNVDGLDTLLKSLVNSATHKVEGTEDKYDLNHYYLLQGSVTANINVIGIKVGANIQIKSVAVYIDEETNDVSIDAHIYYDGVQELNQVAIDGDADVYLSICGNRIIIKKIQYSHYVKSGLITNEVQYSPAKEEVRSMTLQEFADNLMDNLTFLFSFGSVITSNIENSSGGSGVSFDGYDYGKYLNTILAYYVSEENAGGASWTIAINGNMLTSLVGMTMSDIPVKFSADLNGDGTYTVKTLEILKSKMELLGDAVKLEYWGSFTYCNPHEEMGEGYVDTSDDLFNMSVKVNSDYDLQYINSSFTVDCGSYAKLPLGVVSAYNGQLYMLDGYTENGTPVQFEDFVEEDGVRYGLVKIISDTEYAAVWGKAYTVSFVDEDGKKLDVIYHENTVLDFGNMPACPEKDKYTAEWVSDSGASANGTVVNQNTSFKVQYTKAPLKVTLNSTVDFSYTGYDGQYKSLVVGFGEGANYSVADATATDYTFLGWWYQDGDSWRRVTSVDEFVDSGTVTLEALWIKASVAGDGTGVDKNWKYNYTINATVAYELACNQDLLDVISCTYTSYRFYVNNDTSLNDDNADFYEQNGFMANCTSTGKITTGLTKFKSHWHAVVDITFTVASENVSLQLHGYGENAKTRG